MDYSPNSIVFKLSFFICQIFWYNMSVSSRQFNFHEASNLFRQQSAEDIVPRKLIFEVDSC
jgi:hypothetical protein